MIHFKPSIAESLAIIVYKCESVRQWVRFTGVTCYVNDYISTQIRLKSRGLVLYTEAIIPKVKFKIYTLKHREALKSLKRKRST